MARRTTRPPAGPLRAAAVLDPEQIIERDVLPTAEKYGMGTIVFSPLAQGMLTGRLRKGRQSGLTRSGSFFEHFRDENRLDAVEQLIRSRTKQACR